MKTMEKHPESKAKIRFPDCDPFNHLNNSKYVDYLINAREDHLLDYYGLDVHKIALTEGISWVVGQNQVAYLSPAFLMETVSIQTRLVYFDERSLLAEALMWNENKSSLKAVMWTTYVHVDLKTQRSRVHSAEWMEFFPQILSPAESLNFDNRVKALRAAR